MDMLAQSHSEKQFGKFWKLTNKINAKSSLPVLVGGSSEPKVIAEIFKRHFKVESPLPSEQQVLDTGFVGGEISTIFTAAEVASVIKGMVRVHCQFRFDYSFDAKVGGWLKLHKIPVDFLDAFRMCDAEGAVLASPLNAHLKKSMLSMYKKSISGNIALYTGIHSTVAKGVYASVEGKPMTRISMEWAPNEPDNYDNTEDCIVMVQNGTMADVRCTETFPFICYKEKTVDMALNECGTVDNGYQLDARTGSCYKFHNIGRPWNQAYKVCMAEGGHLAIINSETEAQVIVELFAKNPKETIFSKYPDGAALGFREWGEKGVLYTIDGQKLQESGYWKFTQGQPDDWRGPQGRNERQACGGIFRDGALDDMWCTESYFAFICEKKPDSLLSEDE